ncbi:MAG TPA: sucrase ferredoxin [Candidatus Limnocylindria bacterium]|nr:sucrase ferredoxin [Candidatus Limnocylindria bacterium]
MTVLSAPMRCSARSEELDEPMIGSVDERVRWLLIEDRSAWGEKAVRDVLGAELEAAAKERGMRLLLIRRREGDPAADAVRRAILVDTERREMAVRAVSSLDDLPALLDQRVHDFGSPLSDPILLVCTNGKRDACCALRGRALMAALASDHAERTWECTHLGGHRFAGNLVCLPDGVVYGRVTPADGPRLADAYLAGRLDPQLLRGRSPWPAPAQVAEQALRLALGLTGISDVALQNVTIHADAATAELHAQGQAHRFELAARRGEPRPISCRADEPESPIHWAVVQHQDRPTRH